MRSPKPSAVEIALYWLLLVLPVAVAIYAGFHFSPLAGRPADFAIFRTAAEIVKSGRGAKLYHIETQQAVFHQVTGGRYSYFLVWNHHPAEAILYLPAAAASYEVGLKLARVVNTLILCALVVWVAAKLGPSPGRLLVLFAILMAGIPFSASVVTMAQDSIWIMALVLLGLFRALEGRPRQAGILLGLASIKFTIVFPLTAVLWIAGYRRAAALGAGVAAVVAVAPGVAFGPGILLSYLRFCGDLMSAEGRWGLYSELLWCFRGLARNWISTPSHLMVVTFLAGVAYAFAVRWAPRRMVPGLALFGAAFFSPHVYRHDAVMYVGSALLVLFGSLAAQAERNPIPGSRGAKSDPVLQRTV